MIFADHSTEVKQANSMIIEALDETKNWLDVEQAIRDYLQDNSCSPEHIEEQIKRVKDITNYFEFDSE